MALDSAPRALLEGKNFCHVGTLRKDGTPHIVPVWVDTDGEHLLVNTAEGRAWERNLRRDPRATCTVINMENPYEFAEFVGHVAERTTEGADAHIDKLAKKYMGVDEYPFRDPAETRVTFKIAPDRVRYVAGG